MRDARALGRMFEVLDALPVPLIGRIHGAALGGGIGLAAVCDIVVAADDAVFGFTEAKLGIVPAVISPFAIAQDRPGGRAGTVPDGRAVHGRPREGHRAGERDRRAGRSRRGRRRLRPRTAHLGPWRRRREPRRSSGRSRADRRPTSATSPPTPSPCTAHRTRGRKACARSSTSESQNGRDADSPHPDRESRRNRHPRRARLPRGGHRERRGLFRSRRRLAARARGRRAVLHRPRVARRELPVNPRSRRCGARGGRRCRAPRLRVPVGERPLRARVRGRGPRLHRAAGGSHRADGLQDRRPRSHASCGRAGRPRSDPGRPV